MSVIPPSISVLLPFRNAEQTLREAVQSILVQSHTDFELLLIDNHSTDRSTRIAENFAQRDARIQLITETSVGIVQALNTGLAHAKGKYIARMDADDISYPHRFQLQYQWLEQNPLEDVVASQVDFEGDEKTAGIRVYVQWSNQLVHHEEILLNRFVDSPIIHPTVMFRSSLIKKFGAYRQGDFPEDFELWLRWLEHDVQFYKIPQSLLCWRDSQKRLTRKDKRYSSEAFYRIKSEYLIRWLHQHNPFYPEVVIWGAGRKSRQRARLLEEKGIQVIAYIDVVPDKTTSRPCIYYQEIQSPGKYFILSYVSNRGQRTKIKDYLQQKNYQEGVHFLLVG